MKAAPGMTHVGDPSEPDRAVAIDFSLSASRPTGENAEALFMPDVPFGVTS